MNIEFNRNNINNDLQLKLIPISLEHIVINPDKRIYITLKDDSDRQVCIEVNNFEGSMLSFVHKGLFENSHINTIHQLFIKSLSLSNTKIHEIAIESKIGDIIYCSMKMIDENLNESFSIVSIADAIILQKLTKCNLFAIENVWIDLDELDDWDYEDYIVDFDEDED